MNMPRKKVILRLDYEKVKIVKQQLGIDMEKALKTMATKVVNSMYEIAMMKKAGVDIDLNKLQEAGRKLGAKVIKEARKDEDVKN